MFTVHDEGSLSVINVHGELDVLNVAALKTLLNVEATNEERRVIVSLVDCRYCDSSVVRTLIAAKKKLGDKFAVVKPSVNPVKRIFEITDLVEYLSVCSTLAGAVASVGSLESDAAEPLSSN